MRRNTGRLRAPKIVSAVCTLGGVLGLTVGSAFAVELGEVRVESTLGQPLRVSIPFALNPNEQMYDFCVRLRQGVDAAIPTVSRATVAVTGNRIVITGESVIRDPLLNLQLAIDCPYTPQISRQYTLVVDPADYAGNDVMHAAQPAAAPQSSPATAASPQAEPVLETAIESARPAATPVVVAKTAYSPVSMGSEYRVQSGDSASAIASRIDGRPSSLRAAIDLIVASNPGAFIDGDPARLMAGSLLWIPAMTAAEATIADPEQQEPREYAPLAEAPVAAASDPVARITVPPAEPAPTLESDPAPEPLATPEVVAEIPPAASPDMLIVENEAEAAPGFVQETAEPSATLDQAAAAAAATLATPEAAPAVADAVVDDAVETPAAELQPGDVVLPAADSADSAATPASAPPVVAPVVNTARSDDGIAWSWLSWPIGGALLLVAGIVLLGRRVRGAFGSIAIGAPNEGQAQASMPQELPEAVAEAPEALTEELASVAEAAPPAPAAEAVEAPRSIVDDVDFEFTDTVVNQSISLDADFDAGTGLQDGTDLDVAEDFGFSANGEVANDVDHEITEEAAEPPQESSTHSEDVASMLEEAAVPESDDYDLSMIVDATKQSIDDSQLTAQDLQAVPIDDVSTGEYSINDDTLASEADLAALEQDYQDEYTQTQALSKEIEEAAAELAAQLDGDVDDDIDDDDPTADEPILTIEDPGLDPTAQMPAQTTAAEPTAEMPVPSAADDATAQMPTRVANLEETAEMQIEDISAEVTVQLAASTGAENDDITDEEVTARLATAGIEPTVEMPLDRDEAEDTAAD